MAERVGGERCNFFTQFNKKFHLSVMVSWECEKGLLSSASPAFVFLFNIVSIITTRIYCTFTIKDVKLDAGEL